MNIEDIRSLAEILNANGLTSLEVNEGSTRVRLEKASQPAPPQTPQIPAPSPAAEANPTGQPIDFNRIAEVKSPLVGVFYSAPSPDSETFVSIGSKVKKGDVLCIIESMKLMNEVLAEQDGEIVDICIKNGDIAEFGQVLFKMF